MNDSDMPVDLLISEELLTRILDYLQGHHDVVDGPPGYEHEQKPNEAMYLTNELRSEMGLDP
jgi:hypothetical protein